MTTIERLTNADKAQLLHQLFPGEIPGFLTFMEGMGASIKEDETTHRQKWDNGLFNFDFWLSLIIDAEKKIKQYGEKLHHNHRLFADQLMEGYIAIYTVHCLLVYTTTRQHPNQKFTKAVDLLFR